MNLVYLLTPGNSVFAARAPPEISTHDHCVHVSPDKYAPEGVLSDAPNNHTGERASHASTHHPTRGRSV